MSLKNTVVGLGLLFAASSSWAAGIQRVPSSYPNSPILQSVTLPANSEVTYLSGLLPDPVDPKASKEQIHVEGNTEAQARVVLRKVETILASQGLTLGDVVQLRIYLVGDPALGGKLDFDGLQVAFREFFGTQKQPLKPARTTVQVAGLVLPGALIEVETVAARAR
ncbi:MULTISPECIES: RidA family protein [unclassified Pseudomonas]|uniref:RidA family protein n=1 Tax=Pseudomonas TaxID=286 RepID=UPI0008770AE5|nr:MULTISPECIES: RidA family protein [unclassified Pseudomonas]SCZ68118.1 Enamine deaminase RidA, house cleaning of reactive enamine intermediates, YjgF/YER057c/UK114 family [Pseudomonas sp. NFPP17]SDA63535.1 Enamine deaminase RidA, house cleaning of reactive enamine intermediates, YjgF/YER057c/UK114 family [Pseudomonas sp. NFPP15]SEL13733.1 Enamine deaminase RidA, house cleaning of reactive enamine intermediates, YjgF/YER057c/UK114 family [Pseudomonas sp. NFPP18]SFA61985.1 Enamine deaminase Ri